MYVTDHLCLYLTTAYTTAILYAGVLEITAVLPSHAGRYTCSARNTAGVAHKHISLTVQGG